MSGPSRHRVGLLRATITWHVVVVVDVACLHALVEILVEDGEHEFGTLDAKRALEVVESQRDAHVGQLGLAHVQHGSSHLGAHIYRLHDLFTYTHRGCTKRVVVVVVQVDAGGARGDNGGGTRRLRRRRRKAIVDDALDLDIVEREEYLVDEARVLVEDEAVDDAQRAQVDEKGVGRGGVLRHGELRRGDVNVQEDELGVEHVRLLLDDLDGLDGLLAHPLARQRRHNRLDEVNQLVDELDQEDDAHLAHSQTDGVVARQAAVGARVEHETRRGLEAAPRHRRLVVEHQAEVEEVAVITRIASRIVVLVVVVVRSDARHDLLIHAAQAVALGCSCSRVS